MVPRLVDCPFRNLGERCGEVSFRKLALRTLKRFTLIEESHKAMHLMEGLDVIDTLVRVPREDGALGKVILESVFTRNRNSDGVCLDSSPHQIRECIVIAPIVTLGEI